jgi:hypothetical protein
MHQHTHKVVCSSCSYTLPARVAGNGRVEVIFGSTILTVKRLHSYHRCGPSVGGKPGRNPLARFVVESL